MLALCSHRVFAQALAQSDDVDPEMRIQQLENQLRQLTGQNEELQYRNRQLEERLRCFRAARRRLPGGQPPAVAQPNVAAASRRRSRIRPTGSRQPQPGYRAADRRSGADRPGAAGACRRPGRRRGDAFDPSQNPNAPGAPRALGGGQLPIPPKRRSARPAARRGEPLDLANTGGAAQSAGALPPPPPRNTNAAPAR